MAEKEPESITHALAELRRSRKCRVCGITFRPERWDAETCSSTCRSRRSHGGDLAYIASLNTEQAVHGARRFHAHIEALIKEVQAHTAAERERRRERRAVKELGPQWESALTTTELEFLKRPNSTREALTDAVLAILGPKYEFFVTMAVDRLLRTRDFGRRWVFEHPSDSRESLIETVRMLGFGHYYLAAVTIVDEALAELHRRGT